MFTPLPADKFGVILADPPWAFLTYGTKHTTPHRGAQDHYTTITSGDLAGLPVGDTAAKDCCLFMWVVDSHLDVGIELGKSWGFKYKTIAFIWDKDRIGMGYYTRKQAEVCLLFTAGKPKRISKGVRQIIRAKKREHSRKPDEQYGRIEALMPGPYLELFARYPREGWTQWGNEMPSAQLENVI